MSLVDLRPSAFLLNLGSSGLRLHVLLLFWIVPFGQLAIGQGERLQDTENNVRFVKLRELSAMDMSQRVVLQGDKAQLLLDIDFQTLGLTLADARFLDLKAVRDELNLVESQLKKIEPSLVKANEFYLETKHDIWAICEPVQQNARKDLEKLKQEFAEHALAKDVLLEGQQQRLAQLQLRYLVASIRSMPQSGQQEFWSNLEISAKQKTEIVDAVKRQAARVLESQKEWQKKDLIPKINDGLNEEGAKLFKIIVENAGLFSDNPIVRHAQMSPLFVDPVIRKNAVPKTGGSLDFEVFDFVLTPAGQFARKDSYPVRSDSPFAHLESKLKKVAKLLRDSDAAWLELAHFQLDEIRHRLVVRVGGQPTSDGVSTSVGDNFLGEEELVAFIQTPPDSAKQNERDYRNWCTEIKSLQSKSDDAVEAEIRKILLPFQFRELQFAIAVIQMPKAGVSILLEGNAFGDALLVSPSSLIALKEMVTKRREKEINELNDVEAAILDILNDAQRAVFDEAFGKATDLMPSFWYSVAF